MLCLDVTCLHRKWFMVSNATGRDSLGPGLNNVVFTLDMQANFVII